MIRSSWAAAAASVVVLFGGVGIPEPAEAQTSFDCRRASHPSEVAVCQDPGLATADRNLDAVFRAALQRSENPDSLRAEHRSWLRDLRLCSDDPYCLYESYADRIQALGPDPAIGGQTPVVQTDPADELSGAVADMDLPFQEEVPNPPQEAAPALQEIVPSREARSDVLPATPATVERGSQKHAQNGGGVGGLIGGVLVLGLIGVVLAALLATKGLADYSMRKFGWPMILNWWNVVHLVAIFALIGGMSFAAPVGGLVVAGGLWLFMLALNVSKTNLLAGLAMTIVQPFVIFILWGLYGAAKAKAEGRRI